ncbi:MAG: cache domain-containing protein [Desulfobacteraceae bacterium]|nr:cache domain-containing protein [Desulfobacteraceae bacterium]
MMKQRISFTKLIQLWGIIFLVGLGGSIVAIDVVRSYQDFNFSTEQLRADYIDSQKQMIKREVHQVVEIINYEKRQSERLTKTKIKSRVYEAYSIAQNIYQENKSTKITAEIQQMIIDALSPLRFEQGSGYYFISRLDGVAILFPGKPELEGANLLDVQDTHGQYIIKDLIEIAGKSGEGFYEYLWTKPGAAGMDFKKISFIKRFEAFDWLIGTGLYVDDVAGQIKANLLSTISRIRYGNEGYIFINRLNGDALVSNGKLFSGTKKLWAVFNQNPEKIKAVFEKEYSAALKPDGDYIYYSWEKLTDSEEESPKTSFIYGIPDLQWLVGAGVYLDDVETNIALMQTKLDNQIKAKIFYSTLIALGVVAFFLLIFSWLRRRLENDFNLFISFFRRAAFSDELIDRNLVQFDELDWMAKNANKMLQDKIYAQQSLLDEREELWQSEAKFRGLVESSADWIWEINIEGVFTYASPQVEAMLGYKPEEIVGKTPFSMMPPEEAERMASVFRDLVAAGRSIVTLENVNLHKYGRCVILETSGVPVFNKAGKVTGYRGVDRDITERKKAEEELQKMEKLKSVGILAGGIAHDFNNILMGLYGNISLAKEEIPKDHPAFKSLGNAENSMNRAIRLTKQLLTFARGGAPVRENIRIDELVKDVTRFDLSGSNIKPIFKQADDLWMADVDKGQIQQVFSNLIINAGQAMPDGGHLYITLENTELSENGVANLDQGKYIKITVADEGIGIDQKCLDRIFDPYFSTKQTGSGLGLATVYSIITKHGGRINVDSQLGKGTTFTLYLSASESQESIETRQSAAECATTKQTARILVMDDEEMICALVIKMLERSGFSVETALDGRQAIERYQQAMDVGQPFDVVIMDLTIPGGMGGTEAIKDILSIHPEARVIVSSGYANDPVMANYAEYGFCGIAAKPYTKSKLMEVLRRVLNSDA